MKLMKTRAERENDEQRVKEVLAVYEVLATKGPTALNVRDLCERTGTSSPRFYRSIFPSLDAAIAEAGVQAAGRAVFRDAELTVGEARAILLALALAGDVDMIPRPEVAAMAAVAVLT